MKIKPSVALPRDILKAIDAHMGVYKSRSEFLGAAVKKALENK
jgi:Arc/MetJ-type ribon-helix-helix transcriptional regulator